MILPDRLNWFFWSRRACFGLSIDCRQHTRARSNGMALENDFWTHSNVEVVELTISYTLRWGFRKSMNLLLDGLVHNVFLLGSALSISGSWIPLSTKSGSFELSINVLGWPRLSNDREDGRIRELSAFVPCVSRFEERAWVSLPGMSALSPGMQHDGRGDRCDWH